ncbi:hypothetical protein A8L45_11950 [Veronia pacifica]|uniref:Phytoene synthase n=1 Tax=Veronia pacifica TaxID=1080227 RepID=A0A1C3EIJ4_9GAMM|nr:hypothetical protein A8L45_11950 [Veronia pacifica]
MAGKLLSTKRLDAAARLYTFCRVVDDIVDESTDKQNARLALAKIRQSLLLNAPLYPDTDDILGLISEWDIPVDALQSLVCGVAMDLDKVEIADERALIRYSYYVAGTVGEMMCPILGSKQGGEKFAIDLGIAMQMTNIARDVLEDAQMGRRYLPATWVNNLSASQIAEETPENRAIISEAVRRLLALADSYYSSATLGLRYLPFRSRIAIAVALAVYREIGHLIQEKNHNIYAGRAIVPRLRKYRTAIKMLSGFFTWSSDCPANHDSRLHAPLDFSGDNRYGKKQV